MSRDASRDTSRDTSEKIRENRLRRMAARQGLELHKSRMRDPRGLVYGRWWLVDTRHGIVHGAGSGAGEVGDPPGLTVDEAERYLAGEQFAENAYDALDKAERDLATEQFVAWAHDVLDQARPKLLAGLAGMAAADTDSSPEQAERMERAARLAAEMYWNKARSANGKRLGRLIALGEWV
jgi:hypothetical protein